MRGETGYYCQVTHATESLENKDAKQTVQTFTLARTNKALPRKRATQLRWYHLQRGLSFVG